MGGIAGGDVDGCLRGRTSWPLNIRISDKRRVGVVDIRYAGDDVFHPVPNQSVQRLAFSVLCVDRQGWRHVKHSELPLKKQRTLDRPYLNVQRFKRTSHTQYDG